MHDQAEFKARVDEVLDGFVREETSYLTQIHPDLTPVADQLRVSVSNGKRLRATFCYLGWRSCGQPDSLAALRACAARSSSMRPPSCTTTSSTAVARGVAHPRPTSRCGLRSLTTTATRVPPPDWRWSSGTCS
jgi:geranylgeranyl diphosphate synthase type I